VLFCKLTEDEVLVGVPKRGFFGECAIAEVGRGIEERRRLLRLPSACIFTTGIEDILRGVGGTGRGIGDADCDFEGERKHVRLAI
jgi:hypothetical protein